VTKAFPFFSESIPNFSESANDIRAARGIQSAPDSIDDAR
jgi:hypothetical protein